MDADRRGRQSQFGGYRRKLPALEVTQREDLRLPRRELGEPRAQPFRAVIGRRLRTCEPGRQRQRRATAPAKLVERAIYDRAPQVRARIAEPVRGLRVAVPRGLREAPPQVDGRQRLQRSLGGGEGLLEVIVVGVDSQVEVRSLVVAIESPAARLPGGIHVRQRFQRVDDGLQ